MKKKIDIVFSMAITSTVDVRRPKKHGLKNYILKTHFLRDHLAQ